MAISKWLPPPRYIFRRYNVYHEIAKLDGISSFIDVGCGAGDMACSLVKKFGFSGTGVDFSKSGIKAAKRQRSLHGLSSNPSFKQMDAYKMKQLSGYDLVTCFEVLEHVEDDEGLLDELVRLSEKYVIISVPAKQKLFSTSDELAGHYRRYEKTALQELLKGRGLTIKSFTNYGYPFTDIIRLLREELAKNKQQDAKKTMAGRSKKSGTDLLNMNAKLGFNSSVLLWPFYQFSRIFNRFNLSEGYLVVCEKRTHE